VAERIGAGFLNDLYGVWDSPREIDPNLLPDAFALKVTGGGRA
jgi:hypothetical protein